MARHSPQSPPNGLTRKATGVPGGFKPENGTAKGLTRKATGVPGFNQQDTSKKFTRKLRKGSSFAQWFNKTDDSDNATGAWTSLPKNGGQSLNWKALYSKAGLDRKRR